MSQSTSDAKRLINNIMNNFNDNNCRKAWPDFNPQVTLGIKTHINNYHHVTDLQLSAFISIDAGWNTGISNFNFNNPMNNQIVSNNKNKILNYHKVVKSSRQIIAKNQRKINAFFTKA